MDDLEENALKIADYLEDRMSAAEEESFMKELGGDDTLRRQYEEVLMVQALLYPEIQTAMEEPEFVIEGQDIQPQDVRGRQRIRQLFVRYRVAAVLIGLLIGGTAIFLLIRQQSSGVPSQVIETLSQKGSGLADSLFREFYAPWTAPDIPTGTSPYYNAYQQGDFPAAVRMIRENTLPAADGKVSADGRESAYTQLVLGLSYLAMDQKDEAIRVLGKVMDARPAIPPIHAAAAWYLALALIKNAQPQKAIDLLKQLAGTSSPYGSKASRLLSKLGAG